MISCISRVSKVFSDLALDMLWWNKAGFQELLSLLPPDACRANSVVEVARRFVRLLAKLPAGALVNFLISRY